MSSQTDATNQTTDGTNTALYAGAKRRIASLEQQIQTLQQAGSKRKSDVLSNVTQGRVIHRLVSMFETLTELVDESDRRRDLEADEDGGEVGPPSESQTRTFQGYKLLTRHIPSMETKLLEMDTHELSSYFKDLRKGAGGSRGDDAANLKPSVVSWVVALFENPNPPLSPITKADRGFEHDVTGRLLCPIDYIWDDEKVRQNIRDGHPDFPVTGDHWPAFLYPHAKGDHTKVVDGLLRSALLVKAYKFIFTSPTSAQDIECELDIDNAPPPSKRRKHKAPTRGNIANLLGMKAVTPRSIAYIAVQLRFALSNANAWNENDGCFNYVTFYNNIVNFFEITSGPAARCHTQELLAWWTSKVFGSRISFATRLGPNARSQASVSKIAKQLAERELAFSTT